MLPTSITNMLSALENSSGHAAQSHRLKQFGRILMDAPEDATKLLDGIGGVAAVGPVEENMSQLLSAALDEARMARENGQQRGAVFIDALEEHLARLVGTESLSFPGRLAISGCWVRTGLTPPDCLASEQNHFPDTLTPLDLNEPADVEAMFDELFSDLIDAGDGNAGAVHAMFAEMLPTVAADARYALVRKAVARPSELFAELGCAWLLDTAEQVRSGAADGLSDRLEAGHLSAQVLARLTIIRSWLTDDALKGRLDDLIRDAMRRGITESNRKHVPRIHRIVASMVDGSGAQSMAAAIQSGSSRSLAVILLKQGFGVKDAYVIPCSSATEQRNILATIADEADAYDVSLSYMAQSISLALSEGLENGTAPVPGLVDVAQLCDLTELRPREASVKDILAIADPEGRISDLSVQARGRLITASEYWEENYPMLNSWFEDSDEMVQALEQATTRAALKRGMWSVLEARRQHWANVIARNAHLLHAAGKDDADEFIAVAAALADGRDLKKTPVMQFIFGLSLHVWADQGNGPDAPFGDPDLDLAFDETPLTMPADMPMPEIRAAKKGELARLLKPAGLTEPWLDGYLMGVCTAPLFVPPTDWLDTPLQIVEPNLKTEKALERFVELLVLRYNTTLSELRSPDEVRLIPGEVPLLPIWADGYLTAWETNKSCWPAKALGQKGKAIRKLLERAAEGRVDQNGFADTLPHWLKQRFTAQRM